MYREVDSRHSSSTSRDSQPHTICSDAIKRKPSVLVRRMLHIDSTSSHSPEEGSEGGSVHMMLQHSSVSVRKISLAVDESDHTIAGSCSQTEGIEGGESDDVFPLDPPELPNSFRSPKSSTVGRELVASKSVFDFSQFEGKKSVTLRRQLPVKGNGYRTTKSVFFHRNDDKVVSERTRSEEMVVSRAKSKETDVMKRKVAMKRRSIRDLEYHTCLIRIHTGVEDGWSEAVECTSMLKIPGIED